MLALALIVLAAVALARAVWKAPRHVRPHVALAAGVAGSLIVAPWEYEYDMTMLLVAIPLLVAGAATARYARLAILVTFILIALLPWPLIWYPDAPSPVQSASIPIAFALALPIAVGRLARQPIAGA